MLIQSLFTTTPTYIRMLIQSSEEPHPTIAQIKHHAKHLQTSAFWKGALPSAWSWSPTKADSEGPLTPH
jgi:hypothetical protein